MLLDLFGFRFYIPINTILVILEMLCLCCKTLEASICYALHRLHLYTMEIRQYSDCANMSFLVSIFFVFSIAFSHKCASVYVLACCVQKLSKCCCFFMLE